MSTVIDTPEGIAMWVLLSRRGQVQMHLKGLKVKGILSALKRDIGDYGNRVANYVVPIEFAISEAGGNVDYRLVNVHLMTKQHDAIFGEVFVDHGIYSDMDEAGTPENRDLFARGLLECVLTEDAPREPNGQIFQPA
jgi:hypothetical protein